MNCSTKGAVLRKEPHRLSYLNVHKMWIWSKNVQLRCTWKSWLANIRNFYAADTLYDTFHRSTALTFAPGFVVYSTIHTICGYNIAADQITHRIPAISNWNFWLIAGSTEPGYKATFFEVRHSFDFWLTARRRQRFTGEHFAKSFYCL